MIQVNAQTGVVGKRIFLMNRHEINYTCKHPLCIIKEERYSHVNCSSMMVLEHKNQTHCFSKKRH